MLVAIFSDSHDNIPNLEKFLQWVNNNKVEQLIFCGDLCAPSILSEVIAPRFQGDIHMVFGNVTDRELLPQVAANFLQVHHYGDVAEFEIAGKKVAVVHYPSQAQQLAEKGKYDVVFYGHNHKPWQDKIGQTLLLNPGTLAGIFNKATFAVWEVEENKFTLKLLERL